MSAVIAFISARPALHAITPCRQVTAFASGEKTLENRSADNLKINKTILWIASGYALMVATLYLWGYWGSFGLNFLEYIGFGDLLRYALTALLASLAGYVFGWGLSELTHGDMFPPGGGAETPIGRFGRKYWR